MGVFCSRCSRGCCSEDDDQIRSLGTRLHRQDYQQVGDDTRAVSSSSRSSFGDQTKEFHLLPPSLEDEKTFMRLSFSRLLERQLSEPKECSICMECFTNDNPEVETLCTCGTNKNVYHLACLLQWRSSSGKTSCPVCDQEMFFQGS